jgi:superfamily II DNA or RNA helicase
MGNSYSQITGLSADQFRRLKKALSYSTDPKASYFAGGWGPRLISLLDKKGNFPTGLLSDAKAWIVSQKLTANIIWPKAPLKVFGVFNFKTNVTPYRDQEIACSRALFSGRGTISMPTGTGKSMVAALIVKNFGLKTLIVVPTLELKAQLETDFKEKFGSLKNITILNIDAKALKTATDYDLLIIDECHHSAAKSYHKLNKTAWKGIYHRICLTATPYRNNAEEMLLFKAIAGDIIFQLSYKRAIDKGYIVPVEAYFKELPKESNDLDIWAQVYSKLVVNNNCRNGIIAGMLMGLEAQGIPTLCLVKELKHGQILANLANVPFVNGQDEESRKLIKAFNTGKIKVLIGTTGILGEGVDTKPAEYVIIAGLGKAKSAFMQQVGRGVRRYEGKESCKVLIFKDSSHKFTLRHFNEQKKILLEEFGVTVVKL